jgi:hypothetical protein
MAAMWRLEDNMEVWVKGLKLIGSEAPRESFASSVHDKHDQIAHMDTIMATFNHMEEIH